MVYVVIGKEHLRDMCETWAVAVHTDQKAAEAHAKKANEEFQEHAANAAKKPTTIRYIDSDPKQEVGLWNEPGDRQYHVDEVEML